MRVLFVLACLVCSVVYGATSSNSSSPLGINLTNFSTTNGEFALLNVFAGGAGWQTEKSGNPDTGEEACLNLDANGYPKSLVSTCTGTQQFTDVYALLLRLPQAKNGFYPGGQYVLSCTGVGTIGLKFDVNTSVTCPSRTVLNVTPSGAGIQVTIIATDPQNTGNYISSIKLYRLSDETALNSGQLFNPIFLSVMQNFHVLRFMDWLQTNGNKLSSWANRPTLSSAFYGGNNIGAPVELAVAAANAISADAWLNVPHMADDNYITQMATLVHQQLGTSQKVYVEYSNEVWNGVFPQSAYAQQQGQALWGPATPPGGTFQWNRDFFGRRTAQMCDTWKSVWGADANRVVCVMGAQAASDSTAGESLACPLWTQGAPCSAHGIDAVAIAPYFAGEAVPSAFLSDSDGGLTRYFAAMTAQNDPGVPVGGYLAEVSRWTQQYFTDQKFFPSGFKLNLIAYEGGQSCTGSALCVTANMDPRMGQTYLTYLQQWKANGGQMFVDFADIGQCQSGGCWVDMSPSLLEVWNPTTNAVNIANADTKWTALQSFISSTPCWWTGCTPLTVPMPPTNFVVQ